MLQGFTATLERHVDDRRRRLAHAQVAERASGHFSWHSKARKLLGVYERVTAQLRNRPFSGGSAVAPPVPCARLDARAGGATHSGRSHLLLLSAASILLASCNAAVGGGVVALMGGAGYLAGQCYDRVRVRVRDPHTGQPTCNADVWLSDDDGSRRRLRSCYSAALTEGSWTLTALQEGYVPASTQLTIPEHEGDCPSYTHSIELTLRREGEPSAPPEVTRSRTASDEAKAAPRGPGAATSELESPPARVVPPPIPGGASTPVVPTRSFEPIPLAPATPAPAPAPAPAPSEPR